MSKAKFRRSNQLQRTKARRLVVTWYAEQLRDGRARYLGDSVRAHVPITEAKQRNPSEGSREQPWDKPLTARGTETRVVNIDGVDQTPRGEGSNPFAAAHGRYRHDDYIRYVRRCMSSVMACSLEVHKALEMDVAGWPADAMAEELGCGQARAAALVDEGLLAIQMFQSIEKPRRIEAQEIISVCGDTDVIEDLRDELRDRPGLLVLTVY